MTNWGFSKEPVMNLYHMNFGYPMLDAGARVYSSATSVVPRDAEAQAGLPGYNVMDEPTAGRPEECYFLYTENSADGYVMLHNEKRGVAAIVRYRTDEIPFVCEWKNMMAGGYALGLEPVAGGSMDRAASEADGSLHSLWNRCGADGGSRSHCRIRQIKQNMQRPGRRLPGLLLSGRETPKNAPELVYRTQNTAQDFSCVQRLSYRASVSSGRFSNISQPARTAASGNMIA